MEESTQKKLEEWKVAMENARHFNDLLIRFRMLGLPMIITIAVAGVASMSLGNIMTLCKWTGPIVAWLLALFGLVYLGRYSCSRFRAYRRKEKRKEEDEMKLWLMVGLVAVVALTGVMAACTATPKKTAPPIATVKIEATASTWREGAQPYDIYGAIKEKLEETGFEVVPEESTVYDAILFVDYTEDRGSLYGRQYQKATEWGTRITCILGLVDNTQTLIFKKIINASTPPETGGLYWGAVSDFQGQAYFRHLGAIIASKFGVGDEVSVLIDTLQDSGSGSYARVEAAVVLGEKGDPRVIEPLILALEDTDSSVRMAAADALGQTGDERALDPLIHALVNDKDTRVQDAAQAALNWLRQSLKQRGIQSP